MTQSGHDEDELVRGGQSGFSWEEKYDASWEALYDEDASSLAASIARQQFSQWQKQRALRSSSGAKRGILRHLFLIVDFSLASTETDYVPSRLNFSIKAALTFMKDFFDQNPISQLGVIILRDGVAEKRCDLSGTLVELEAALSLDAEGRGEPSIQNGLEVARTSLIHAPSHGTREILVLYSSLLTCDPADLETTVARLKADEIRVSFVTLQGEMRIAKRICQETGGDYAVALNEPHYRDLLAEQVIPPIITTTKATSYLAQSTSTDLTQYSHGNMTTDGFECPNCKARVCQLPIDCPICTLTLISSPHLARSYHHLFPNALFALINDHTAESCVLCQFSLQEAPAYQCSKCRNMFCADCDLFVHESLHNCPECIK